MGKEIRARSTATLESSPISLKGGANGKRRRGSKGHELSARAVNVDNNRITKKQKKSRKTPNAVFDPRPTAILTSGSRSSPTESGQVSDGNLDRVEKSAEYGGINAAVALQTTDIAPRTRGTGREDKRDGYVSNHRADTEEQPGTMEGESGEEYTREAVLSGVSGEIEAIEKVEDIDSPVLKNVEGENERIRKAKKRRRKVLKKLRKNKIEEPAIETDASQTPRPLYVHCPELATLPQNHIDEYLSSNVITIEEPLQQTSLRPILEFSYLPAEVLKDLSPFRNFKSPTPIQATTWPYLLSQRDVIGVAETGSGKTLAFGVPCVRRLSDTALQGMENARSVRAVIVSPTRELAMQIYEQLIILAKPCNLTVVCVYGGVPKDPQRLALKSSSIIVATPGRLNDFISEGSANISNVEYLVLDEADRMLDKGFEEEIRKIISACAPSDERQTLMFTATWPPSIRKLASSFLRSPVKISIGDNGSGELRANGRIEQRVEVLDTNPRSKETRLLQLVRQFQTSGSAQNRILVFVLYKKEAVRVENFLHGKGFKVAGIHGDLSQERRTAALEGFKRGSTPILVATDVAARGLDIPAVKVVINVTFPLTVEDYVHRIGRTGRAGADGLAVTLFTEHDKANSGALINVLRAAKQTVPDELLKFGTTVKRKEHEGYGVFYKENTGGKKATKIKFDD